MAAYNSELIQIIRSIDPKRPISSGFSVPRPSAWHQAHCPLVGDCGPIAPGDSYWTSDSQQQWRQQLAAQQDGLDVWSIHTYPDDSDCFFPNSSSGDGSGSCANLTDVVRVAVEVAEAQNAVLYVGEYGGPG